MAAALRLLLRQHAAAPPSPMLRSLFPAPYSKTAVAAAASLPAERGAPLSPPRMREFTPRKAPPTPKGEPRCCKTVPSTMSSSAKSLLDKLKDLNDSKKSLQGMKKNIDEHMEMITKEQDDRRVAIDLLSKRIDDHREFIIDKINNRIADFGKTSNMQDAFAEFLDIQVDLARVENTGVDFEKDCAILKAETRLGDEQIEMLRKEVEDYVTAVRRYNELARSTMVKVAKVSAAVCLVEGLLLALAKI